MSYNLTLNAGQKFRAQRDKNFYSNSRVVRKKNSERNKKYKKKNITPHPPNLSPFLNKAVTLAYFQSLGTSPSSIVFWKINVGNGVNSGDRFLRFVKIQAI